MASPRPANPHSGPELSSSPMSATNPDLTAEGLRALGLGDVKPENLQLMDLIAFVNDIQRVGRAFAGKVTQDHFKGF